LPISVQPSIIEKALKAGKHVLSEKPIAPDVQTARRLIKVYETDYKPRNISWRVAEDYAHEPGILRAGELVQSGNGPLGPVLFYECKIVSHIESGNRLHATEWRRYPEHQGGFILDGGVHVAAALRVVLGDAA
jgi:predicted dehydrogenase